MTVAAPHTNERCEGESAPIFLVGAPRSGTTMLRLMLNSHPRIAIPFESDFIPKFYRRLEEYGDLGERQKVSRLLDEIAAQAFVERGKLIGDKSAVLASNARNYSQLISAIYTVYSRSHGKFRWGDKDPDNTLELDVLWNLFPGCQIVHIVRDGRGASNSLRKMEWG